MLRHRPALHLVLAVITAAAGIALGVLANARRIGSMAVDGHLDAVLTLPVPPLAHVLLRRVEATNVGDLAFGLILFWPPGRRRFSAPPCFCSP